MNSVSSIAPSVSLYVAPTRNTSAQALIAAGSALASAGGGSSTPAVAPSSQPDTAQAQPAQRPAPINGAANADYNSIVSNAQDGNINLAQAEYTKLQIDLTQVSHHVHTVGGAVPASTQVGSDSATPTETTTAASGGARFSITV